MRRVRLSAAVGFASLLLVPATAPAAPSAHAAAATSVGLTNQCVEVGGCGQVTIELPDNLRTIKLFTIEYLMGCETGKTIAWTSPFEKIRTKVTRKGASFTRPQTPYMVDLGDGEVANGTINLSGTVGRNGRGHGTFQASFKVTQGGNTIDSCMTSTPVAWRVKK